jgi:hypothetical protein
MPRLMYMPEASWILSRGRWIPSKIPLSIPGQLYGQRESGGNNLFAYLEPVGIFVDLHEGGFTVEADDLADQLLLADAHDVVHLGALEVLGDHRRSCDFLDDSHVFVLLVWGFLEGQARVPRSTF